MVLRLFGLKDSDAKARPKGTVGLALGTPDDAPLVAVRRPVTRQAGAPRAKPVVKPKAGRATTKRKPATPRRRPVR